MITTNTDSERQLQAPLAQMLSTGLTSGQGTRAPRTAHDGGFCRDTFTEGRHSGPVSPVWVSKRDSCLEYVDTSAFQKGHVSLLEAAYEAKYYSE